MYCENHTKHTNTLCGCSAWFYTLKQFSDHRALMVNQPYTGLHGVPAQKTAILIITPRGNWNLISVILAVNWIGILPQWQCFVSYTTFQILAHKKALVINGSYIIQYLCETGPFRIKFCLQKMAVSLSSFKSVVPSGTWK
jgi:hypothetical protein